MKRVFLILTFITLIVINYSQNKVGKVSYLIGSAEYKNESVNKWDELKLNSNIFNNWEIKTLTESTLEITWDNGEVTEIKPNKKIKIKDLMKNLKVESSWTDRMKNKLKLLVNSSDEDKKVQGVAGVRRTEVTVESKDSLYWATKTEANFKDAYGAFLNNELSKAAELFEEVINSNPLDKNSEMSRSFLIYIYAQLNKYDKAREHLVLFKRDFPNSEVTTLIIEAQNILK